MCKSWRFLSWHWLLSSCSCLPCEHPTIRGSRGASPGSHWVNDNRSGFLLRPIRHPDAYLLAFRAMLYVPRHHDGPFLLGALGTYLATPSETTRREVSKYTRYIAVESNKVHLTASVGRVCYGETVRSSTKDSQLSINTGRLTVSGKSLGRLPVTTVQLVISDNNECVNLNLVLKSPLHRKGNVSRTEVRLLNLSESVTKVVLSRDTKVNELVAETTHHVVRLGTSDSHGNSSRSLGRRKVTTGRCETSHRTRNVNTKQCTLTGRLRVLERGVERIVKGANDNRLGSPSLYTVNPCGTVVLQPVIVLIVDLLALS